MIRLACLLFVLSAFAPLAALDPYVLIGYRTDYFRWSIGTPTIDVLSELQWWSHGPQVIAGASLLVHHNILFEGEVGVAAMLDGRDRDSDYHESNRSREFSRSHSRVRGSSFDLLLSAGYVQRSLERPGCLLIPKGGVVFNHLQFRSHHGVMVVGERDGRIYAIHWDLPSEGVNATYDADWAGLFFGFESRFRSGICTLASAELRFHSGFFRGEGDWRLRPDLHRFTAEAPFWGLEAHFGWEWMVTRRIEAFVSLRGNWRQALNGTEFVQLTDGGTVKMKFNGAYWLSAALTAGLRF